MRPSISLLLLLVLFACSSAPEPATLAVEDVPISVIPADQSTPSATLYIQGMSCEKMCVGKVKTTLAGLDGVDVDGYDFDADKPLDSFTVSFDENKTDERALIRAVNEIAGGVYSVTKVEVKKQVKSTSANAPNRGNGDWTLFESGRTVKDYRFQVPNVFDALKSLTGI